MNAKNGFLSIINHQSHITKMRSKNNKETGFIPVKERRALATFAVRRSRRSAPVPSSNEDEDHEAEPSEEERSLEEVIPPANKVKSSEGGIEIDGQRAHDSANSSPQKRTTMCSEDVVDSQPSKKAKTSADEEMICSICNIAKNRLDCFSKNQRKSGGNSKCQDCTGYVSTVQKSKAYAEMEEKKYNSIKKVYEGGLKKLKEENIDFEKEMNKRTDYLYMVTSVSAVGDPFSPVLHGIYTTCKKAQDAARRAFEKVSDTYRNGAFVPNGKRISKCDLSEFLVPARKTSTSRLLYEAFTEPQDDCCQYTAVAVSSTQMVDGTASGCDLPFMGSYFLSDLFDPKYVKNSDEDRPEQNGESRKNRSEITKVYAIFDHYFGNMVRYCMDNCNHRNNIRDLSHVKGFSQHNLVQ